MPPKRTSLIHHYEKIVLAYIDFDEPEFIQSTVKRPVQLIHHQNFIDIATVKTLHSFINFDQGDPTRPLPFTRMQV